jgi:hypothetical protein
MSSAALAGCSLTVLLVRPVRPRARAAGIIAPHRRATTPAANFPDHSVEKCPKILRRQSRLILRRQFGRAHLSLISAGSNRSYLSSRHYFLGVRIAACV